MRSPIRPDRGLTVPSDPLARLVRLGGMASGIAGSMLVDGARQLAQGKRPSVNDLLLTPANARRVTDQLAQLRGAAMKVGQLLSMDAGEILPPEMTAIMARLRADAHHMPPAQLLRVLARHWGPDWRARFARFDMTPIAAASIGQVHRAQALDGRDLAIKIQYPGIRASIDSDVSNVAALMRMSGLVPRGLDVAPLLDEARKQLHEEADYAREGASLRRFGALLHGHSDFCVPAMHDDFSNADVLAMDFIDSVPVEALETAPQDVRDRVAGLLIALTLRELFGFRLMQTDPNFANYRYSPATGQVVLLDFGATREFPASLVTDFRALMNAGLAADRAAVGHMAKAIGLYDDKVASRHQDAILNMMEAVFAALRAPGSFDFGSNDLTRRLRDMGMAIGQERDLLHVPPVDTLFLNRKFGGIYLLASRLRARVDVATLLALYR